MCARRLQVATGDRCRRYLQVLRLPGGLSLADLQLALLLAPDGDEQEVDCGYDHDDGHQDVRDGRAITEVPIDEGLFVDVVDEVQRRGAWATTAHEVDNVEDFGGFGGHQHQVNQHRGLEVGPDDVLEPPPDVEPVRLGSLVEVLRDDLKGRDR